MSILILNLSPRRLGTSALLGDLCRSSSVSRRSCGAVWISRLHGTAFWKLQGWQIHGFLSLPVM
ncbi:MAG: hypothetical protein ACLRL6_08775 [Clostridium sp.]